MFGVKEGEPAVVLLRAFDREPAHEQGEAGGGGGRGGGYDGVPAAAAPTASVLRLADLRALMGGFRARQGTSGASGGVSAAPAEAATRAAAGKLVVVGTSGAAAVSTAVSTAAAAANGAPSGGGGEERGEMDGTESVRIAAAAAVSAGAQLVAGLRAWVDVQRFLLPRPPPCHGRESHVTHKSLAHCAIEFCS
jgi:hypothetical protein